MLPSSNGFGNNNVNIQKTARSLAEKLKLWILNALLWGGVILLVLEHVWHHEVVPWPPFLTAMATQQTYQ